MSFKFSSCFCSSSIGFKCRNASVTFFSGRVVIKILIQTGSIEKWLLITCRSSLRPLYSLSSRPSMTIRVFLPGSCTVLRGSLNSNANSSFTPMLLRSLPRFLDSCSTRASL